MSSDFLDSEIWLSSSDKIPDWMAANPFKVRYFRSAIEAAYGPSLGEKSLEEAFANVKTTLEEAAARKIKAVSGDFDPPMPITRTDVLA